MDRIFKYPRTPHIAGSRLQRGDADDTTALDDLRGQHLVIEEKVDGANAGLSFDAGGRLVLQCRGHALIGGPRERQFSLFKRWAWHHAAPLYERLGARYLVFGEWCYARHTVYYDALPHYLLEFDVYDREAEVFLSTPARRALLDGLPIRSVPVLWSGLAQDAPPLTELIRPTPFKTPRWRQRLAADAAAHGMDPELAARETDSSERAEGLYLKVEAGDQTIGRYKFVRHSFTQAILDAGGHWMDRPLVPNRLAEGVDLFAS